MEDLGYYESKHTFFGKKEDVISCKDSKSLQPDKGVTYLDRFPEGRAVMSSYFSEPGPKLHSQEKLNFVKIPRNDQTEGPNSLCFPERTNRNS